MGGCLSCKHSRIRNRSRTISTSNSKPSPNHLVSLTSSSYGLLKVDSPGQAEIDDEVEKKVISEGEEEDAVTDTINAWEMMEGLDDDTSPSKKLQRRLSTGKENASSDMTGKAVAADPQERVPFAVKNTNVVNTREGADGVKTPKAKKMMGVAEIKIPSRRLDSRLRLSLDLIKEPSSPLFDPSLLASFECAINKLSDEQWEAIKKSDTNTSELSNKSGTTEGEKDGDPLQDYEERCPPGGEEGVVVYTTTLRGIRKTFEECNNVRDALESYGVGISERDVSMHLQFRSELKVLMMGRLVNVPRVFIKGRYIGGADEVMKLHDDGRLSALLSGIPKGMAGRTCEGCAGVRFIPCLNCNGSCKLYLPSSEIVRCPHCNENGLIQCPICC